jgi:hypothetical protein
MIEPLFALFGRYTRWPQTGHLAIDNLLHQSADWWMLATLTDAGREALTTRDAT